MCLVTKESDWLPRRRKICVSGNKRERMMTEKEDRFARKRPEFARNSIRFARKRPEFARNSIRFARKRPEFARTSSG
ncbi:hypothetical protein BLX88_00050 [Bacillus obstructivus]|nr:hypothetical protein BLX88_00050 [Bacillus obstructivus]